MATAIQVGMDIIDAPLSLAGSGVTQLGAVTTLDEAGIARVLTNSSFAAGSAVTFTNGTQTYLAFNDEVAGYSAANDAIIEISGFTGNTVSI